jgi:hypothetical protein
MSKMQIYNKIWKVAPAFIGGDTNDVEARATIYLAVKIYARLPGRRYYKMTVGELVSVACAKYFGS